MAPDAVLTVRTYGTGPAYGPVLQGVEVAESLSGLITLGVAG
jgi:hypothetical protein